MNRIRQESVRFPQNMSRLADGAFDPEILRTFGIQPEHRFIKRGFVTKSGVVLKNLNLVQESIPRYPGRKRHFQKAAFGNFALKKRAYISGSAALIHNPWCPGYFHWMTEALPRALAIEEYWEDYTILLPDSFPAYTRDSLTMLGVKSITPISSNVRVNNLLISENTHFTGEYNIDGILKARDRFLTHVDMSNEQTTFKRVYLSRSTAPRRKVANEHEFASIFSTHQVDTITTDNMSLLDQVKQFAKVQLLISIHGAGLTNMLFMPKGSTVIELQPHPTASPTFSHLYLKLANILGLKYYLIPCQYASEDRNIYTGDIIGDIEMLQDILSL